MTICPHCNQWIENAWAQFCTKCGAPLNTQKFIERHSVETKESQSWFSKLVYKWRNRSRQKKWISYGRKIRYNWDTIEDLNKGFGISRETCFVDENGYLRWKKQKRLCHRDIAYRFVYTKGNFSERFSAYDVHHRDGNKFNNHPSNLEILTRERHELTHGKITYQIGVNTSDWFLRIAAESKQEAPFS